MVVVGSIDGLVCLAYNDGTSVVIWNPSTRKYSQVPDPQIPRLSSSRSRYSYGFAKYNGYKVVRIIPSKTVTAEVYDCQTTSWAEFLDPPQMKFSELNCGTILKGMPYWPSHDEVLAKAESKLIIWFDPEQNQFNEINRPEFKSDEDCYNWTIGTSGDALVMLMQTRGDQLHVWMKDDGEVRWIWQLTLGPIEGIETWTGCWKNLEFLGYGSFETIFKDIRLYDAQCKEMKSLPEITPKCRFRYRKYVTIFSESLVSPYPPWPPMLTLLS